MQFSWSTLPRPIVALAPMAGYTDSPYRQLVKLICPQAICFTEFTNVDGLLHGNAATRRQVEFHPDKERPIIAQLFGHEPETFAKAAKIVTEMGVDAVDINMGCPAKKIVSSDHGSALLKAPEIAAEIVAACVAATHLPVSVKTRIGIGTYDPDFFIPFVQRLEKAGAQLITIHGRTAKQMYSGKADWQPIYDAKRALNIPVIGNGDITNAAEAQEKLQNLDGVMVGRGTFGNPWILQEIVAGFEGTTYTPPSDAEKYATILEHMRLNCEFKGEEFGILEMRKHFAWYIRGFPNASAARQKLVRASSVDEALTILESVFKTAESPSSED
ncbi:tRNA dihydrouridine synthase DusB [Candidatus Peregrinibacteria bacterium CG11_big_fil_rev_8_21_14_0_20_46_8]|nr:MAG: tRNA dihydrouridine synthase DusB [Candidatus Peregrinibacteria bacterium CG11_big_fil_rev_8_21_14_0_20_46_8]